MNQDPGHIVWSSDISFNLNASWLCFAGTVYVDVSMNCSFSTLLFYVFRDIDNIKASLIRPANNISQFSGLLLGGGQMSVGAMATPSVLSSMTTSLSAFSGSQDQLSDMDLDLQDARLNIDDVMNVLPASSSWDSVQASTSQDVTAASGSSPSPGSGQHTPVTHVSWSNMISVNMTQASTGGTPGSSGNLPPVAGRRLPVPISVQQRNMLINKSPVSPGFTTQVRSPGFAQQRSPGFLSHSPSPGAQQGGQGQQQIIGSAPGQRSPMGGMLSPHSQGLLSPHPPNMMSPPPPAGKAQCFFDVMEKMT